MSANCTHLDIPDTIWASVTLHHLSVVSVLEIEIISTVCKHIKKSTE